MLRIRFHGRGGHGVKTASRILGTAAFISGFHAQDSPIYGAERRGAAVAAFTRISRQPIHERGVIAQPDLIVIGDETLLRDAGSAVLAGQQMTTASSLIGQRVAALTDTGENVEGVVDRVSIATDEGDSSARVLRIHVGNADIRLENIREIIKEAS